VNEQAVTHRKIGIGRSRRTPSFLGSSNGEEQYRPKRGHRQPARIDYPPAAVFPFSRAGPRLALRIQPG
jgi:hypothetical protein